MALRYVERFATTRGKLAAYLSRKIRERGWAGEPIDPAIVAERMATLGYVDDRLFAEARARSLARCAAANAASNSAILWALPSPFASLRAFSRRAWYLASSRSAHVR